MSASENIKKNQIIPPVIEVVALALRNSSTGKYMLARRGPGQSGAGEWEFPGGKIEAGETQKQALVREIKEELNFELDEKALQFSGENTHHYPNRSIRIFLWSSEITFEPQFQLTDHDETGWFTTEKIKEVGLSHGDKHFISLLKS
ncbi:MAG: (deoxy)nucleoside triphosphate pyrophosphohydrolase [Pseudobdellovibrio sp.]